MFLTRRFFICAGLIVLLMVLGYWQPFCLTIGQVLSVVLVMATAAEGVTLYTLAKVAAARSCSERFSNGDPNKVNVQVFNGSPFRLTLSVVDEVPIQFQLRSFSRHAKVEPRKRQDITYSLTPVTRGDYHFGRLLVFATTRVGLFERRFSFKQQQTVKVYPSFLMLKHYQLLSSIKYSQTGQMRTRRVGHNTEFEHIKEYVKGDDYRTINWKASARRHQLMVNVYQEEKSQYVVSLIDKGRTMQQVSQGMTLLDYAINTALMLSHVAICKQDNAGLITFVGNVDTFLLASHHPVQMKRIMEALYNQQTEFGESDYSMLCPRIGQLVSRRSLMMLYTNFTGVDALNRQLPYLREINQRHRLLVIFFEDEELADFAAVEPKTAADYCQQVAAEKFILEKRLVVSILARQGISSLLTTPSRLTVDTVNKYMEMKAANLLS